MLIPRVNRGLPDKVFAIVRNFTSATILDGIVLRWATSADVLSGYTRIPGVDVAVGTAAVLSAAGISAVANTITGHISGEYGLCQVYGYHSNVSSSGATDAVGVTYIAGAAGVVNPAGAAADDPSARLGVCITTGVGSRSGVIIKCMG